MPTLLAVARSCEKFGCRERADVAFGIDRIACVVWLETYDEDEPRHLNRMCAEHAGRLTLPRGWSFDDRREKSPRLFVAPRPTPAAAEKTTSAAKPARKASKKTVSVPRRTSRDASASHKRTDGPGLFDPTLPLNSPLLTPLPATIPETEVQPITDPSATLERPAYAPKFDRTSDVGGTLNATGRLLRRAFSSQTKPIERPSGETSDAGAPEQGDHIDDFNQGDHIE